MALEKLQTNKAFGGQITKYKAPETKSLGGLSTQFNVFIPSSASASSKAPVLYWLAGLTCTEDTAPWKTGVVKAAAEHGLALVFPDTSPRGAGIDGENDDWDFGTGAGFYLNATSDKFKKHYRMQDLILDEIPSLIEQEGLPIDRSNASLIGHSMGGHGALSLYLKTEGAFKSASAFAPIANPTKCPWGEKAFKGYLASPAEEGPSHDSTLLVAKSKIVSPHILITYGTGDDFYKKGQLLPENFDKAVREKGWEVEIKAEDGYDHSMYFVSTFVDEHIAFHAKYLQA